MPDEDETGSAAAVSSKAVPAPALARFFYRTRGLWNLVSLGLALVLKAVAGSSVPPWAYGLLGAVVLATQGWRIWAAGFVGRPARGRDPVGDTLITAGPYAWVRNPMYLGTVIGVVAFAGMSGLWYAVYAVAVAMPIVYGGALRYEEAFLAARFGEEYQRYRRAVPRLLPTPRPYRDRQGRFRLADGLANEAGSVVFLPLFFVLFWFVGG